MCGWQVKRRKEGVGEPVKFMGCGVCDNLSRSETVSGADLMQQVRFQILLIPLRPKVSMLLNWPLANCRLGIQQTVPRICYASADSCLHRYISVRISRTLLLWMSFYAL